MVTIVVVVVIVVLVVVLVLLLLLLLGTVVVVVAVTTAAAGKNSLAYWRPPRLGAAASPWAAGPGPAVWPAAAQQAAPAHQ